MVMVIIGALILSAVAIYIRYRNLVDKKSANAKLLRQALAANIGFLIAPAITALLFATHGAVVEILHHEADFEGVLVFSVIVYIVAFVGTLIIGVPTFIMLARFDLIRWWSCATAGLITGVIMEVVFGPGGRKPNPSRPISSFDVSESKIDSGTDQ